MQQNFAGFLGEDVTSTLVAALEGQFAGLIALLLCAVVLVWSFKRVGLPPILAYLLTGLLAGSYGFGWISNSHEIQLIAELGIVFLLFSLGLEFSIPKLMAMRSVVFGLGSLQVLVTTVVLAVILKYLGFNWIEALIIASLIALSSTAVVVKELKERGILNIRRGQLAVGVLLFQDIAVVPLLITIPLLSQSDNQVLVGALILALAKGAFVCMLLWAIGKWVLPKVFNEVAMARTDELFVLTTLVVALCAGALTYAFGLSMALGAFLAGMMLGESQFRHQLEAEIRPFRDILMGLFFVTVGTQLDVSYVIQSFIYIVLVLALLIVLKLAIIFLLAQLMGERRKDAFAAGILLWQMGEFGFVLVALAGKHQLLSAEVASFLIALGVLSMALTPYLISETDRLIKLLRIDSEGRPEPHEQGFITSSKIKNHVVIFGYARVGQTIARFLRPEAIPYIAVERNPAIVQEALTAGEPVVFGDPTQHEVLKSANVSEARLVIVSLNDFDKAQAVIDAVKRFAPEVKILVRMKDDTHLEALKELGATEVVPESLEASLMMVSHVLYMSGVPMRRILKRVSIERQNRYEYLHGFFTGDSQEMKEYAGAEGSSYSSDRLEYLHAIALPDEAFAVDKSIAELDLARHKVVVKALRRNGEEISMPDEEITLCASDVLLLKGKPRRVERAEQFLLDGLP